ncbi:MAG: DUF4118 domain-containing protein [Aminipila sp.]
MELERPEPEILIKEYEQHLCKKRGKLKIFFGYAAGVGKTYAMLEAARQLKSMGVDVVAGYVEPHLRPETIELLEDLEQIPKRQIMYKGMVLSEFDLDEALNRKPQLILVDELAHTNAEGCRHKKRYQDVEELLRAGIDVYTTINVQHLESLNDLVSSITGVVVNERVPDYIFDDASQVEVIDIEPDDLLRRLKAGKVYKETQTQRALESFFSKKNLEALREIALRRTADCLNKKTEEAFGRNKKNAGEHILVCISHAPSNPKVIRTAARMAEAFHCQLTALYVESSLDNEDTLTNKSRLTANLKLAEDLGCRIATVYGDDIAVQISEYAKISGITKIVVGRTNPGKSIFSLTSKSLINKLTNLAPNLDIYIIPDSQSKYKGRSSSTREKLKPTPLDLLKSFAVIPLVTMLGFLFYELGFSEANIITVYILGVLISAIWTNGKFYGVITSLLSVITFNFFFTEPRFTMQAYGAGYPLTFIIMFLASFITSGLAIRVKRQAYQAAKKAYRTEVLLETNQKLQQAENQIEIIDETAKQMLKLLGRTVIFYSVDQNNKIHKPRIFFTEYADKAYEKTQFLTEDEKSVAQWVYENNKHAGATTSTLPSAKCLYLAVRGKDSVFSVAGIYMPEEQRILESFEKNLLIALIGECGLALEKISLINEKKKIEIKAQQEQLRSNLLRGISHDLRTPLTSISGNAGILMDNVGVLDEEKKKQLYEDIYDDSMWLINLVENLLSVTRIENGNMNIHTEPELIDDIFFEAFRHLDRKSIEHDINIEMDDELLMVQVDASLIVQVIINIVNNAIKYTPVKSKIVASAQKRGKQVVIEIADDGSGIGDESKERLFDMFFTVENNRLDGRRGLGLGLSLCKSIIDAHGGKIYVKDNQPKGTIIGFTLKAAEVESHE